MEELYSIGETAKLNHVSVKSLRHYDEIGLLKPRHIDPDTGYRYYSYNQFSFIDKIKRYKNIGMTLMELKDLFQGQDLEQLAGIGLPTVCVCHKQGHPIPCLFLTLLG